MVIKKQLQEGWIAEKREQGLFPKSGNWYYPDRWVTKDDFIEYHSQERGQEGKEYAEKYVQSWEAGTGKVYDWQKPQGSSGKERSVASIKIADEEYAQQMVSHQQILSQEIDNEESPYRKDMLEKQNLDFNEYIEELNALPPELQDIVTNAHEQYYTAQEIWEHEQYYTTQEMWDSYAEDHMMKKLSKVMNANVENFEGNERNRAEFNADLIRIIHGSTIARDFEYLNEEELESIVANDK